MSGKQRHPARISQLSQREQTAMPNNSGLADLCEQRAKEVMLARWSSELTVAQMAEECSMSPAEFERAFCEKAGMLPRQYLAQIRVTEAKKLLLEPHLSLTDVRVVCGFRSQRDFTQNFTRLTGESPAAWRRRRSAALRPMASVYLRELATTRVPLAATDGNATSAEHKGLVSASRANWP